MIHNRYYNKNFIIGGIFVAVLFLSMTYWIIVRTCSGKGDDSEWLFYAMMMAGLAVVVYVGMKEPLFVSEYDDRLVIRYLQCRKRTVMFDDIADYRYPVFVVPDYMISIGWRRDIAIHRIMLKGGGMVDLYDTFIGLDKFALGWQERHADNQGIM